MKEADLYKEVQLFAKKAIPHTAMIEVKITKGNTFNLSSLMDHQYKALELVSTGVLTYKIPDVGYDRKPADIIMLRKCRAYVAICYAKDKKRKTYYINFKEYKKITQKSITEQEAFDLSEYSM